MGKVGAYVEGIGPHCRPNASQTFSVPSFLAKLLPKGSPVLLNQPGMHRRPRCSIASMQALHFRTEPPILPCDYGDAGVHGAAPCMREPHAGSYIFLGLVCNFIWTLYCCVTKKIACQHQTLAAQCSARCARCSARYGTVHAWCSARYGTVHACIGGVQ